MNSIVATPPKKHRYRISNYIPIPPRWTVAGSSIYPFARMNVGDSFGFPLDDLKRVSSAMGKAQQRNSAKYTVRRVLDNKGVLSGRCWRVK